MKFSRLWTSVIKHFESYLSNWNCLVCTENVFPQDETTVFLKDQLLDRSFSCYVKMTLLNNHEKLSPICMQKKFAFSTT